VILPAVAPQSTPQVFSTVTQEQSASCTAGEIDPAPDPDRNTIPLGALPLLPVPPKATSIEPDEIQWRKLARDAFRFLAIMHGFRWATEAPTRAGGAGINGPYLRAVENLHGWADGDPFYVNYVGHPLQGAIAGRLFLLNDARYNRTEFGQNREYWKGKLRATAFAWAYSEQFEIGPISEATVGHIQAYFPQQGFVDHVVTPSIGLVWMMGEDAIDRYIIKGLEGKTDNKWMRIVLRTTLNPARTFANVVDGRAPWDRGSRAGILTYKPEPKAPRPTDDPELAIVPRPAPFEVNVSSGWRQFAGSPCVGGGAEAAYRVSAEVQLVLDVNGCKLMGLEKNLSGDALVYQIGPRWTPAPTGRWSPYAHLLFGGMKVSHEQLYPDKKQAVEEANKNLDPGLAYTLHDLYTSQEEASSFAITAGTGVDYKLSEALAFRVANVEYLHSGIGRLGGLPYSNALQVSTGMVLRLGTW
jgi:hypothetical protein